MFTGMTEKALGSNIAQHRQKGLLTPDFPLIQTQFSFARFLVLGEKCKLIFMEQNLSIDQKLLLLLTPMIKRNAEKSKVAVITSRFYSHVRRKIYPI